MALTQLSPTGWPGRRYSFAAKTAAPTSGPHTGGPFTQQAPTAWPGKRYSFLAKTGAEVTGPHTGGPFTQLHPTAWPGARYSFTAKAEAEAEEEERLSYAVQEAAWKRKLREQDNELVELLEMLAASGALD